jgi:hypothetical protein
MVEKHRAGRFSKLGARMLAAIGRQTWLDRPSYRFEHMLAFGYNSLGAARDRVTNALQVSGWDIRCIRRWRR